jgi:hypothetical protein
MIAAAARLLAGSGALAQQKAGVKACRDALSTATAGRS